MRSKALELLILIFKGKNLKLTEADWNSLLNQVENFLIKIKEEN